MLSLLLLVMAFISTILKKKFTISISFFHPIHDRFRFKSMICLYRSNHWDSLQSFAWVGPSSHHGYCVAPWLHFSLHPPPSLIWVLWRSQMGEGGVEDGRYQINPHPRTLHQDAGTSNKEGKDYNVACAVCYSHSNISWANKQIL